MFGDILPADTNQDNDDDSGFDDPDDDDDGFDDVDDDDNVNLNEEIEEEKRPDDVDSSSTEQEEEEDDDDDPEIENLIQQVEATDQIICHYTGRKTTNGNTLENFELAYLHCYINGKPFVVKYGSLKARNNRTKKAKAKKQKK